MKQYLPVPVLIGVSGMSERLRFLENADLNKIHLLAKNCQYYNIFSHCVHMYSGTCKTEKSNRQKNIPVHFILFQVCIL
jgi:hypothetical protein